MSGYTIDTSDSPQDVVEGQIVVGADDSLWWFQNGTWHRCDCSGNLTFTDIGPGCMRAKAISTYPSFAYKAFGAHYTQYWVEFEMYIEAFHSDFAQQALYMLRDPAPLSSIDPYSVSSGISFLCGLGYDNTAGSWFFVAQDQTTTTQPEVERWNSPASTALTWHTLGLHASYVGIGVNGGNLWNYECVIDGVTWPLGSRAVEYGNGTTGFIDHEYVNAVLLGDVGAGDTAPFNSEATYLYMDNLKIGTGGFGSTNIFSDDFSSGTISPPFDYRLNDCVSAPRP